MKLIIEVEVPDKSVEEVRQFVVVEDAFDTRDLDQAIAPEAVTAVEVFVALYMSGHAPDWTVTKAEMTEEAQ